MAVPLTVLEHEDHRVRFTAFSLVKVHQLDGRMEHAEHIHQMTWPAKLDLPAQHCHRFRVCLHVLDEAECGGKVSDCALPRTLPCRESKQLPATTGNSRQALQALAGSLSRRVLLRP